MAEVNPVPVSNSNKTTKIITHYINVNVLKADGTPVRLGAIVVYDNGEKAQRTLIDAVLNKGIKPESFDVVLDVRENIKSTDLDDINDWATRTDGLLRKEAEPA